MALPRPDSELQNAGVECWKLLLSAVIRVVCARRPEHRHTLLTLAHFSKHDLGNQKRTPPHSGPRSYVSLPAELRFARPRRSCRLACFISRTGLCGTWLSRGRAGPGPVQFNSGLQGGSPLRQGERSCWRDISLSGLRQTHILRLITTPPGSGESRQQEASWEGHFK